MRATLHNKIIGLVLMGTMLPVIVIVLVVLLNYRQTIGAIDGEIDQLVRAHLGSIARDIRDLCDTTNRVVQAQVDQNLVAARKLLNRAGGAKTAVEPVRWRAVNQETKKERYLELPRLVVGGSWLGQNADPKTKTPFVDDVVELLGGTATVFQRMNARGDMLRVGTNVSTRDGRRAVGTYIPAINPDGKPNPVVATVMAGDTFRGQAKVVDDPYVTAYEPLRGVDGKVMGMLYVGVKQDNLKALRRRIREIKIGADGYVAVIGTIGSARGRYVISKDGKRDGEYIWDARDVRGRYVVREAVRLARAAAPGQTPLFEYEWLNPGEAKPRHKIAAMQHYKPWGWTVMATLYKRDLVPGLAKVRGSVLGLVAWAAGSGLLVALLAGMLAVTLVSRLTRPFASMAAIAGQIAAGDLQRASRAVDELEASGEVPPLKEASDPGERPDPEALDEGQLLLRAVQAMTRRLNSLVGQVQRSGIQVNSSSVQISASAHELDATVSEQATATNQVLATTTEITSVAKELEQVVHRVARVSSEAAGMAGAGREDLQAMQQALQRLADATETIASRLAVIGEKTDKVQTVVTTIGRVADQTNLLSLNAAIEAEKAGEYGRGFSVVAREIRRLADQTAVATREIEQMFEEMQGAVGAGMTEMGSFSSEVREVVGEMQRAGTRQEQIIQRVQTLEPELEQVNAGMSAQSRGAEQIREAMVRLADGARQTADALAEFQRSAEHLNEANRGLQRETSQFKVVS